MNVRKDFGIRPLTGRISERPTGADQLRHPPRMVERNAPSTLSGESDHLGTDWQDHTPNLWGRADTKNPTTRLGHRPASGAGGEHRPLPQGSRLIARPARRPHWKGAPQRPALRARRTRPELLRPRSHRQRTGRLDRHARGEAPGRALAGRGRVSCSSMTRRGHGRAGVYWRYRSRRDVYVAFDPWATVAALHPASVGCSHKVGFAPLSENGVSSLARPSMTKPQRWHRFTAGLPCRGRGRSRSGAVPRCRQP